MWSAKTALLTLDVGTSAVKAVAFAYSGQALAEAHGEYGQSHPLPGRAEQDPALLLEVTGAVLAHLSAQLQHRQIAVAGLCLSGTMHGLMAVSAEGTALTPYITWADSRAEREARFFAREYGSALYARTGVPLHPMTPLHKLRWLRANEPDIWEQAARFCSFKEWLHWHLTGTWVVDEATAAATGLWQLGTRDWDDDLLTALRLTRSRLSKVVEGRTVTGASTFFARDCGLPDGVPVVLGSTDGVLANLGSLGLSTRALSVTGGTSAALRQTVRGPLLDPHGRTFCYPLADDYYVVGGGSNTGGMVLGQVAEWLGLTDSKSLLAISAERESCPEGLYFLPYLAGERAPLYNPRVRGSFVGLAVTHGRADLARAAVDGVGFTLRWIQAALNAARSAQVGTVEDGASTGATAELHATLPTSVVASGGLAASPVWLQLLADQLQLPVRQSAEAEATCLGAFILGAQALGWYPTLEVASATVLGDGKEASAPITYCDAVRSQVYDGHFLAFQTAVQRASTDE